MRETDLPGRLEDMYNLSESENLTTLNESLI